MDGCIVKVYDVDFDEEMEIHARWFLQSANSHENKISNESARRTASDPEKRVGDQLLTLEHSRNHSYKVLDKNK